jgi:hypothetical protein
MFRMFRFESKWMFDEERSSSVESGILNSRYASIDISDPPASTISSLTAGGVVADVDIGCGVEGP